MFENIGQRIQKMASLLFIIGLLLSFASGIAIIVLGARFFFYNIVWVLLGAVFQVALGGLISYLNAILLYGFGTQVSDTAAIKELLSTTAR